MNWWQSPLAPHAAEEQLDKELRFHLDQHVADLIAQGHDPEEARRQARLALGGPEQVKEYCRDTPRHTLARGSAARRPLRRSHTPAAAGVCGGRPADARPRHRRDHRHVHRDQRRAAQAAVLSRTRRLVTAARTDRFSTQFGNQWAFAYPELSRLPAREPFSLIAAAWRYIGGTVSEPGDAEYVDGREISPELFSVLGVPLARGRAFLAEEDRPGAAPAVIVSDGFWQRRFGGSPAAIGARSSSTASLYRRRRHARRLPVQGDEVGCLHPARSETPRRACGIATRIRLRVLGAPAARRDAGAAQTELALVGRQLAEQYPESNTGRSFIAEPLRPDRRRRAVHALVAAWRGQPGAADRVRQHGQPAAGARGVA